MPQETWRTVHLGKLNIPSPYQVSDKGRVRRAGKILRPYHCPTRNGVYLKVDLRFNGLRYQSFVHRLVAQCFVENPERKPEVNHFDENPFNNCSLNLMWATRVEQEAHKLFMRGTA